MKQYFAPCSCCHLKIPSTAARGSLRDGIRLWVQCCPGTAPSELNLVLQWASSMPPGMDSSENNNRQNSFREKVHLDREELFSTSYLSPFKSTPALLKHARRYH